MSSNARNQLEFILSDEKQRELFLTVLHRLHCAENLLFYVDVIKYRSLKNVSERITHAYIMWETFFNADSLSQINVDAETLRNVRENVAAAPSTLFDQALNEIMTMLEFDSLPKYLRSEQYKQFQLENSAFLGTPTQSESLSNPFQGQTSSPRLLRSSKTPKKAQSTFSPLKTLNGDQVVRSASSPAAGSTKKRSKLSKLFSAEKGDDDAISKQSPSKKRSRDILESAKSFLEDSSPAKRVKRATKLLDFFGVPPAAATEALDELTPRSAAAASSSAPKLTSTPIFNNENSENGGLGAQARRSTYQAPTDW